MIIVLTPVKNEDWILDQFLTVTSLFADCIIIADQQSSDDSTLICSRFPKVKLIENKNRYYNEADRQLLLIEAARNLFPNEKRILFCLDADEIITADSINAKGWEIIKDSKNGTVFKFEKPTIFFDNSVTIRYFDGWPLAYTDDGVKHHPSLIHSTRIPTPKYATQIIIDDIKFLHLCFVRPSIQFSKNRYYCVIENINHIRSLRMRRIMYSKFKPQHYAEEGEIQPTKESWFKDYDKLGVDIKNFIQKDYHWMDFEVLRIFNKYGTKRFFNDSIWHFDWEACRQEAIARNLEDIPTNPINCPSSFRKKFLDYFFGTLNKVTMIKRSYF